MKFLKITNYIIFSSFILLSNCTPKDGDLGVSGLSNLTSLTDESQGVNCQYGGVKIENGLDLNSNSVLDLNEITSTSYVCDGFNLDYQDETRIILFNSGSGANGTQSVEGRKVGEILNLFLKVTI